MRKKSEHRDVGKYFFCNRVVNTWNKQSIEEANESSIVNSRSYMMKMPVAPHEYIAPFSNAEIGNDTNTHIDT